jgi:diguanylate cyclase (GGDEF)-like protein
MQEGRAEAREGGGRPAEAGAAARPRILVVDDVFDNRDILTRRLIRRGFDVAEASGGLEALEKLEAQSFDLVLLDIMMPDLCGNEVLRLIRKTKSPTELPVIMVTAKSQSEDVVESLEIGANDYVTKPVDFAVALARITAQLARKQAAEAEAQSRNALEKETATLHLVVERNERELRRTTASLEHEETQRRLSEERLRYLAYHDGLTGLLNRTAFREFINTTLAGFDRLTYDPALLFIDLDRFKAINDVYGHEVGDRLLQDVAKRLRALVGQTGWIARLGGDEFGVFLHDPAAAGAAEALAERIVRLMCEPFSFDDRQYQIGASCGVARARLCGGDHKVLVKAADLAMYRAKSDGRSRWIAYNPGMLEAMRERSLLEIDLREAIAAGRLEVHYQPLVNAETRRVSAFEALVRWRHPERGMLAPDLFIPIAEETGMIVPLGELVLRLACATATNWPEHVGVAVNLSPLQFRSEGLLPTIEAVLAETGLDPRRLDLEITESALLEAREQNDQIIQRIRALGIRVSLDDFGTGYSSMSYLQTFKLDKIKIDRRFVRGLTADGRNAKIVKAIADLSASLGVDLVAEGVETPEELEVVASFGCTEFQGYLFSRPMPEQDACAFVLARDGAPPE